MNDALAPSTKTGSIHEAVVRTNGGRTLTYRIRRRVPLSRLLSMLLGGFVGSWTTQAAFALPVGGQVTSGQATVTQPNGQTVKVNQSTSTAVLNWQSFSIAGGETVIFAQPSSSSVALNRVLGTSASSIYGSLVANGQVFLINPNGILFGKTATVNVGGLVASTLNLTDKDFLQGNYTFSGTGGPVTNEGSIRGNGGLIALVGSNVSNSGTIQADGGAAILAAGSRVSIDPNGNGLIAVSVDPAAAASIVNEGAVIANGGSVIISAKTSGALLDTVINTSGIVRAGSIGGRSGRVTIDGGTSGIVAIGGEVSASGAGTGAKGGAITVLGDKVGLFDGAKLDASGDIGGGTVLVGGAAQGLGPQHNASATYVAAGASIAADALVRGDGGQVVVWSDGTTKFLGTVTARGGSAGGNGGAVETSSAGVLLAAGKVDASAPKGMAGTWLLDPNNITIADTMPTGFTPITPNAPPSPILFDSATDDSYVSTASLTAALAGNGTTVSVSTRTQVGSVQPGNITVSGTTSTGLAAGETATLNLNAAGDIVFSNGTINSGLGSLNVNLNSGIDPTTLARTTNPSTIDMTTGTIATGGGNVSAIANGAVILGAIDTRGSAVTGDLIVDTGGLGGITQTASPVHIAAGSFSAAGNPITLTSANDIQGTAAFTGGTTQVTTQAGLDAMLTTGATTLNAGGSLAVAGTAASLSTATTSGGTTTFGTTTVGTPTSNGDLSIVSAGTTTFGAVTVNGNLGVTAGGAVTQAANPTTLTVTGFTTINGPGQTIALGNTGNDLRGNVTLIGDTTTLTDIAPLNATLTTGATTLTSGGALIVSGTAASLLTTTTNNSNTTFAGTTIGTPTSNGDLSIVSAGTTTFGAVTVNGNLGVTAGGAVTQAANPTILTVTGFTTINGPGQTIALGNTGNDLRGNVTLIGDTTTLTDIAPLNATLTTGATTLTSGGALIVSGTAASLLTTTTNNSNTTFAGTTIGTPTSNGDLSIVSAGTTTFGAVTVNGNLGVTAGGAVTQAANPSFLTVTGTTTINGPGQTIALGNTGNDLRGNVTLIGGTTTLTDIDPLNAALTTGATTLASGGALTVTGTAAALSTTTTNNGNTTFAGTTTIGTPTANGDLTVNSAGATTFGTTTVNGNLGVTSAGAVTQAAAPAFLKVTGNSTITAPGQTITLTNAGNDFQGPVALTANSATVSDADSLTVILATTAPTTLTSGGTLTVSGTAPSLSTTTTNAGNTTFAGTTTIGTPTANGNLTVVSAGTTTFGTTAPGNTTVNGNLNVTSAGAVTQPAGPLLKVTGSTTISAAGQTIALGNAGNDFQGPVSLTGDTTTLTDIDPLNVTLATGATTLTAGGPMTVTGTAAGLTTTTTAGGTTFGATTVNGDLRVTSAGPVTQAAAPATLWVTRQSNISAPGQAITLANAGNDFGGLAAFAGGQTTIVDANALTAALNTTGTTVLTANGALGVTGTSSAGTTLNAAGPLTVAATTGPLTTTTTTAGGTTTFGTTVVNGALFTTSAGAVNETGTLIVTGPATIDAGTNAIALGNANDFAGTATLTGGTTTVADVNALTAVLATGATTLTAGGPLSVSGTATGLSTTTTGGGNTTFGTTTIGTPTTSGNLAVNSAGATTFGTTTVNGALSVVSGGAVTQAAAPALLKVTGNSTITAPGQTITLANAGTDFGGTATVTGGATTISDANALTAVLATTGTTALTAAGPLAVSGTSAGTTSLVAAGPLTVSGSMGALNTTTSAGGLTTFGTTTVAGALNVLSAGNIVETGPVSVAGSSTLNAGANAIVLGNAGNDFSAVSIGGSGPVTVVDRNDLTASLTTSGATALTAGGGLTVSGTSSGATTLVAAGPLNVAANTGNLATTTTSGGTTTFGTTAVTGTLNANSGGAVVQTGPLSVSGASTIASGGAVTLTGANQLVGPIALSGSSVAFNNTRDTVLTLASRGDATITAANRALSLSGSAPGTLQTSAGATSFGSLSTGILKVNATGDVTQAANSSINVGSQSMFVLMGSNLLLANPGNVSFGSPVNVTLDHGKQARFRTTGAVPQFVVPAGASPDQQFIFFNDIQVTASQASLFSASVNAAAASALNEELRRLFSTDSAYQEIRSGTLEDFVIPTPNLTTKGLTQPQVRPCPPNSPSTVQDPKCAPNEERTTR